MKKLSPPLGLLRKSIDIFFTKENFVYFLKLMLIFLAATFLAIAGSFVLSRLAFPTFSKGGENFLSPPLGIVAIFILFLFFLAVWAGPVIYESVFRVVEKGALDLEETIVSGWKKAWKFFLVSFVLLLLINLGFVLVIIPGIILGVWFSFSQFIAISEGLGAKESLAKSRALVKGYFFPILGRLLVFMLVFMLIEIILSLIPFFGSLATVLLGPFFILPSYLLYKELST
ncbi:MAG: hypothetical protein ACOYT7_04055 [Patescibacteria group bacterium]